MKKSIYFRNFFATAVILLMSFSVLGCLFSVWSYRIVMSEKRETMSGALEDSVEYLVALSRDNDFELNGLQLHMTLSTISGITGYDILLTDSSGVVVLCSDRDFFACEHMGKMVPEHVRTTAQITGRYNELTDLGRVYSETRYVVCRPLTAQRADGMVTLGYIFLSSDASSMVHIWRQFAGVFLLIAVIVMIITFIISLVTTKKQAEPLKEMAQAAQRFARGEFDVRVKPTCRQDEIGQLANAFNAMAASLQSSETLRREFIANISHELKTPMTVIAGFADGILDGTIPPENEARYLGIISSETMRLSRLVKSMLDLSKIQSADAIAASSSFDVSEVIRLALLSLGSKIDSRELEVAPELPEEPVITVGDRDAITQVVYNLIDNAIKFSEPGGTVRIALWKQGSRAFVSVENRGDTIPEAEMPLIFDRFHKSDKARSADRDGVGLGLYIVKTILDKHNEDIFVTSRDGVTKFVFTLTITG